jgi:hypothetical protein
MRRLNAQLLEAGLTLKGMTTQFDSLLITMRRDLEAEAKRGVAAGPDGRAAVQGGPWGSGGMPDLGKLMADPDVREAMADPKVVGILQACMADPSQIMQHRCAHGVRRWRCARHSGARLTSLVRRDNLKVNKLLMALFKQQGQ